LACEPGGVVFNRAFFIGVDAHQWGADNKPLSEILRDKLLPIRLSEESFGNSVLPQPFKFLLLNHIEYKTMD